MPTGGQLLIQCLEEQGVDRIFCVPGESYLAALDAMHDAKIEVIKKEDLEDEIEKTKEQPEKKADDKE